MSDARIVDRGFQHYTGPRLGLTHAMRAMVWASIRRGMGVRRAVIFKLLPGILILIVYVIVLLIVSSARALGTPTVSYRSVYTSLATIFMLFAGVVAPALLCSDRRERVTSLYFAAPMTRAHYVGAQVAALALLLTLLTVVPLLLLFASYVVLAPDAGAYLHDHLGDLWHIVLGGGLLALYYSAVALAVAALTDRQSYATGIYFGVMLVSAVAGSILSENMTFAGHDRYALLDLVNLPVRAVRWLFGQQAVPDSVRDKTLDLGAAYMVVSLAVVAGSLALLVWRYRKVHD